MNFNINDMPLPLFQSAVNEAEYNIQAPYELCLLSALSAVAITSQGLVDVCLPIGSIVPTSLMLLTVANSGERKSTVENRFFAEMRSLEEIQLAEYEIESERWKESIRIWELKNRILMKAIERKTAKSQDTAADEVVFREHQQSKPSSPSKFKLLYEDTTAPAMFLGLKKSFPSAGLVSSEGGSILGGAVFNDLSKLNAIWSGDSITVDRVSAESFHLSKARLTVSVMVQPNVLRKYIDGKGEQARGSGFLARFLVCDSGSTQGTRYITNEVISWRNGIRFNLRIRELLDLNLSMVKNGGFIRKVMKFSPEAAVKWTNFYNKVESQIRPEGRYDTVGDHASKLAENVARVAAILHFFEGVDGDISVDAFESARLICNQSSWDFIDLFVPPPQDYIDGCLLNDWLNHYRDNGRFYIEKNTIRQRAPNLLRDKRRLNNALENLLQRRLIRIMYERKTCVIDLCPLRL